MDEINNLNFDSEIILRKEPSKIYSYNIILIITVVLFIIIGNFVRYHKFENFIATVVYLDGEYYLQTNLTEKKLKKLKDTELYIGKEKYNFKLKEFERNKYDNNYNVLISVEGYVLEDLEYIVFSLKNGATTIFKEIFEKVREELKL